MYARAEKSRSRTVGAQLEEMCTGSEAIAFCDRLFSFVSGSFNSMTAEQQGRLRIMLVTVVVFYTVFSRVKAWQSLIWGTKIKPRRVKKTAKSIVDVLGGGNRSKEFCQAMLDGRVDVDQAADDWLKHRSSGNLEVPV